jgi:hypothetical protein
MVFAFGKISADFLDQALHVFVGFWAVMIVVALTFFAYVLITVRRIKRAKSK